MSPLPFFLFKRSNGIWYVAINNVGGKRHWKSTKCTDKHLALQALHKMDLRPAETKKTPLDLRKDVNTYLTEFLAYASTTYRPKSNDIFKTIAGHLSRLVGKKQLKDVGGKTWDDFVVMRSSEVSPASVNMEQRALKAMLNKAVEWKYLEKSPFTESKNIRVAQIPPRYFTKEEFDKLLHLVEVEWLRQAIIFSISTGIRRGELINLRWTEVDIARRVIMIQSSPSFRVKGNKTRVVPLSSVALEVILRQKEYPDCAYVFSLNRRQIDGNWMSGLFRRYVKQAGLYEKKLHWHNL